MSAPSNHWKLGAFVLGAVLLGLATVIVLAARTMQLETVSYTSYFDEGVTGLEIGSPVSFRGVRIGNVSAIDVAPDRRHVEVVYSLGVRVLGRLGLVSGGEGKQTKIVVPPDLRVQLASAGMTGAKFLLLDFFDAGTPPPATLPFPVPENTISTTPSTMKNLEAAVVRAVDALPDIALAAGQVLGKLNLLLADLNDRGVSARVTETLSSANLLMGSLQSKIDQLPVKELSREAVVALKNADAALARLNHLLDRLGGERGLVASLQRATDSVGDAAGAGLGADLSSAAREVREAASATRAFLEALDRDPDMLLKGKARHP